LQNKLEEISELSPMDDVEAMKGKQIASAFMMAMTSFMKSRAFFKNQVKDFGNILSQHNHCSGGAAIRHLFREVLSPHYSSINEEVYSP